MTRLRGLTTAFGSILGVLALAGCAAVPPAGPSVMALPAKGKSFAQFQQDDATCRQWASLDSGGATPQQAATDSAIASAAVGTLVGAAAGAALGAAAGNPAMGAAIGAGSGLLLGSAAGSANAGQSAATLQQRYDMRYLQCMAANGESIPTAAPASAGVTAYPAYPTYPPPPPPVAYGYYGPNPYYYGYYPPPPVTGSVYIGGWFGGPPHHRHWR